MMTGYLTMMTADLHGRQKIIFDAGPGEIAGYSSSFLLLLLPSSPLLPLFITVTVFSSFLLLSYFHSITLPLPFACYLTLPLLSLLSPSSLSLFLPLSLIYFTNNRISISTVELSINDDHQGTNRHPSVGHSSSKL